MKRILLCSLLAVLTAIPVVHAQTPVGTAFSYQGRLNDAGVPATGSFDLKFELYDADAAGTLTGAAVERAAVNVANGLFTTELDFGGPAVFNGTAYRLQISVKPAGGPDYTALTPRQPLRPVPYAIRAESAASVADGSITSASLAAGAVTGAAIAPGAVALDQLNTTGAPATGMVLAFDGANLTWLTPGAGGPGGGSLTLPFSGLQSSPGALFAVNNMNATGDSWGIYGHSQTNLGVFGQTHGNAQAGVLGRNDGATGVNGAGVFGYASTQAHGVLAISEMGTGLWAATNGAGGGEQSAIYGQTAQSISVAGRFHHLGSGTALTAEANGGWAMFGRSQSGLGVFGQTITNGTGVLGRNESNNGQSVHGYSSAGATGVRGDSVGGDGVVGTSSGAGKSGVYGYANRADNNGIAAINDSGTGLFAKTSAAGQTAGFFWNSAGGDAIRTDGAIRVGGRTITRVLEITGGADVVEPFAMHAPDEILPGHVVTIAEDDTGTLELSRSAYNTCVAGIVSGANGINPGICLSQEGVNADGQHKVALSGRVYCMADASLGEIKPGDLLTTSDTPGHAMKVRDQSRSQGAILGKAMSRLARGEKGHVLVLVTLQ